MFAVIPGAKDNVPCCVGNFGKAMFDERRNVGAVYLFDPEKDAPILVSVAPRCFCQPQAVLHAPAAPGLPSHLRTTLTGTGDATTIGLLGSLTVT